MWRILLACVLIAALLHGPSAARGAPATALAVQELALATGGAAYEVEPDPQGRVWVSEYGAGELWHVDPAAGSCQAYEVGGSPGDAHSDGVGGGVWWLEDNMIHYLDTTSREMKDWFVKGSIWLWGLGVTSQGKLWINDSGGGNLLYFDPDPNNGYELKTYTLPNGGQGYYPAVAGDLAWLGDEVNERLLRLDASQDHLDWWQLPSSSAPYDVAVDAAGNVWYTDRGLNQIGRLEPSSGRLTTYALPAGQQVKMLSAARSKIWFSEEAGSAASFGSLDPQAAAGSSGVVDSGSDTLTPGIDHLTVSSPAHAGMRDETFHWSPGSAASASSAGGWAAYSLPGGASPWGIAVTSSGWVVDRGNQVLVRFPLFAPNPGTFRTFLPMVTR